MEGLEQFCLCQALFLVLSGREMNKSRSVPSDNLLWSLVEVLILKIMLVIFITINVS